MIINRQEITVLTRVKPINNFKEAAMESLKKGEYSGEVKLKKNNGGIILSITQYDQQHFNGEMHDHCNPHFGFTVRGGCVERKLDRYELKPGDLSYYRAGEKHQVIQIAKPSIRVNLEIEPSFTAAYSLTDDTMRKALTRDPKTKFLMVNIYSELLTNDNTTSLAIQGLLLELFHQSDKRSKETRVPAWLTIVCDYMHDRCQEPLTLTEIAEAAAVHPVTVSRYFARYTGYNLGDYLRRLRVEKALGLIKGSGESMAHIAYQCGFFDQSHFNRCFKKYNGILPGRYKKLEPR